MVCMFVHVHVWWWWQFNLCLLWGVTLIKVFVLDEVDELLCCGFSEEIMDIFYLLPPSVQVLIKLSTDLPQLVTLPVSVSWHSCLVCQCLCFSNLCWIIQQCLTQCVIYIYIYIKFYRVFHFLLVFVLFFNETGFEWGLPSPLCLDRHTDSPVYKMNVAIFTISTLLPRLGLASWCVCCCGFSVGFGLPFCWQWLTLLPIWMYLFCWWQFNSVMLGIGKFSPHLPVLSIPSIAQRLTRV